jgi:hypothetical protein
MVKRAQVTRPGRFAIVHRSVLVLARAGDSLKSAGGRRGVRSGAQQSIAFMTGDDGHRFALPPATGDLDGIDLAFLNPDDEDDRRVAIRQSIARGVMMG